MKDLLKGLFIALLLGALLLFVFNEIFFDPHEKDCGFDIEALGYRMSKNTKGEYIAFKGDVQLQTGESERLEVKDSCQIKTVIKNEWLRSEQITIPTTLNKNRNTVELSKQYKYYIDAVNYLGDSVIIIANDKMSALNLAQTLRDQITSTKSIQSDSVRQVVLDCAKRIQIIDGKATCLLYTSDAADE